MLASASNQRYNLRTATRAVSSVVEHILHTDGVTSSNLVLRSTEKAVSFNDLRLFLCRCTLPQAAQYRHAALSTKPEAKHGGELNGKLLHLRSGSYHGIKKRLLTGL